MPLAPADPDIAILGAGAWGRALAGHARRLGRRVAHWAHRADPGDPAIGPATEVARAAAVIVAVPTAAALALVDALDVSARPLVFACKGLDPRSGRLPVEVQPRAAVLTGPTFAHELAAGLPTAAVVASADPSLRRFVAELLGSPTFRLYPSDDAIGASAAGAAKNVIAVAAGAVVGAGLGENARAALVTRGLAEIARFASALGGRPETVAGLAGMGDLILTCTGDASRNCTFGQAIGRGASVSDALAASAGVVEGAASAPLLLARARDLGVEMPITEAVASVIEGRTTVGDAVAALLSRPVRGE